MVTVRRTGKAKLLLSPICSPLRPEPTGNPPPRCPAFRGPLDNTVSALRPPPAFKFLTVRNLITPWPRRSYDCVSVNSLQCGQALHGSAPASLSDRP